MLGINTLAIMELECVQGRQMILVESGFALNRITLSYRYHKAYNRKADDGYVKRYKRLCEEGFINVIFNKEFDGARCEMRMNDTSMDPCDDVFGERRLEENTLGEYICTVSWAFAVTNAVIRFNIDSTSLRTIRSWRSLSPLRS